MEFSIQNASIGTPTKINLLYQILQKADNMNFRRIWLRVSDWKRTTTRTLRTYKTLSHTHTVYGHTKHSAICTLCRNTKHSAICTLCRNTKHSAIRTLCRNTKHSATRTLFIDNQHKPHHSYFSLTTHMISWIMIVPLKFSTCWEVTL